MKKMSSKHLFLVVIGIIIILVGVLVSEPVVASFSEDGEIGSGFVRIALWTMSLIAIVIGAATIWLRKSETMFRIVMMLCITILMFLFLDYALYFSAPILPASLVRLMTPQAQLRFFAAHEEEIPWIYEENFRYSRPGRELNGVIADEYGYRNPENYLPSNEGRHILLIGDSFTWGTADETIADHMRAESPEQTVYSAGVFGNSISQWRYHYVDYVTRIGDAPDIVVFNLYAGNDLSDTELFRRVQDFGNAAPAITYFTFYNYPYFVPSEPGGFALPKIPEMVALTLGLLQGGEIAAAEPTQLETEYSIDEAWPISHEPLREEFSEEILQELDRTVALVNETSPGTEIVISYIPTIAGVYGALLTECSWCDFDIEQQAQNSALIAGRVETLGVHYVDVTPILQEAALQTPMWGS